MRSLHNLSIVSLPASNCRRPSSDRHAAGPPTTSSIYVILVLVFGIPGVWSDRKAKAACTSISGLWRRFASFSTLRPADRGFALARHCPTSPRTRRYSRGRLIRSSPSVAPLSAEAAAWPPCRSLSRAPSHRLPSGRSAMRFGACGGLVPPRTLFRFVSFLFSLVGLVAALELPGAWGAWTLSELGRKLRIHSTPDLVLEPTMCFMRRRLDQFSSLCAKSQRNALPPMPTLNEYRQW